METINPAIIAVIKPFSGETPEAMAKAMANGSATIPTIKPEVISFKTCSLLIPLFISENNFGMNSFSIFISLIATNGIY